MAELEAINNATTALAALLDTQTVSIELCHLHRRFRGPRGRHNGERHAAAESVRIAVKRVVCKASHDHVSVMPHVRIGRLCLMFAPIVDVVAQHVKPCSARRWT